jgi:hypothetical protein
MAQFTSFPYEPWQEILVEVLEFLRSAVDRWAVHGRAALDHQSVTAVIVQTLIEKRCPTPLSLSVTNRVDRAVPLNMLLASFGRKRGPQAAVAIAAELLTTMSAAAESWSRGDQQSPRPEDVLHDLAALLFRNRLVRFPPPRVLEDATGLVGGARRTELRYLAFRASQKKPPKRP